MTRVSQMLSPFVAAAVLLAASPALAADAALAGEVAHHTISKQLWTSWVDGLAQDTQARMQAHPGSNLQWPADFQKQVRGEIEKAFPYESMVALHTKELAAAYSDAELKDVLAFFKSPSGSKWMATSGGVAEKANAATMAQLREKMPEIMTKLGALAKSPPGAKKPEPMPGMPAGHPPMGAPAPADKKPAPPKK